MKEKLVLKKEDILLDNFNNGRECPFTRSFRRAGYNIEECGGYIVSPDGWHVIHGYDVPWEVKAELFSMYRYMRENGLSVESPAGVWIGIEVPQEPADIEYEMDLPPEYKEDIVSPDASLL